MGISISNATSSAITKYSVSLRSGDEKGNLSDVTAEFYCRLAIGGAFRKTAETLEETIKRADDEMYKNKHSVRKA